MVVSWLVFRVKHFEKTKIGCNYAQASSRTVYIVYAIILEEPTKLIKPPYSE